MKNNDQEIKNLIKSIEKEIPGGVEAQFLSDLDNISCSPGASRRKLNHFMKIALATAASLMLALMIFSPMASKKSRPEPPVIMVESARIEGQSASTVIFKEKDPELTIVWIEKTGEES